MFSKEVKNIAFSCIYYSWKMNASVWTRSFIILSESSFLYA